MSMCVLVCVCMREQYYESSKSVDTLDFTEKQSLAWESLASRISQSLQHSGDTARMYVANLTHNIMYIIEGADLSSRLSVTLCKFVLSHLFKYI